ncbi:hypothetical protein [Mogibacterium timidum]|uniref:hypothetical protein n=1 Tax=Mogibacterium timidum TaxID=35519 RepID=UPI00248AA5AA|nr:hypothetical protein [Mogibacterium timidum]
MAKFQLNKSGVRELLRSSELMEECSRHAKRIQNRCGEGYEVTTHTGKNRVNASVHAKTIKARKDNAKNNTLLKAMRG